MVLPPGPNQRHGPSRDCDKLAARGSSGHIAKLYRLQEKARTNYPFLLIDQVHLLDRKLSRQRRTWRKISPSRLLPPIGDANDATADRVRRVPRWLDFVSPTRPQRQSYPRPKPKTKDFVFISYPPASRISPCRRLFASADNPPRR